jgi:hypothetical protein
MTHNLENIKYLVHVLNNKKESTFRLKDKALRNYYKNIGNVDLNNEESKNVLMPYPLFRTLVNKFLPEMLED